MLTVTYPYGGVPPLGQMQQDINDNTLRVSLNQLYLLQPSPSKA